MKNKTKKRIVLISILFVLLLMGGLFVYLCMPVDKSLETAKFNIEKTNNLMIVAHPDDETIWGGSHISGGDYLVVCITCGSRRIRVKEFEKIMALTHNEYIMLGYPDKTRGKKDNWDKVKDDIQKDIAKIISLKNWKTIVTHNPDGEYGHIHHKMTSRIVTNEAPLDKLFYFGHYYSKEQKSSFLDQKTIGEDKLKQKEKDLISVYKSQNFIKKRFGHMFPYENWLSYVAWNEEVAHE